jgi:hypothetical protein
MFVIDILFEKNFSAQKGILFALLSTLLHHYLLGRVVAASQW